MASNLTNEAEVLLSRGTTFKVLKVKIIKHPFIKGVDIYEVNLKEIKL